MSGDDLDRIIDGALATYGAAEPLEGIERRVLARVRAKSRRHLWIWGLIAAFAAVLALAFIVLQPIPPPPAVKWGRPPACGGLPARLADQRSAAGRRPAPQAKHRRLPKAPVFPLPSPLTAEERALVALAGTHPQVLEEMQKTNDEPLEIRPIEIAPLPGN